MVGVTKGRFGFHTEKEFADTLSFLEEAWEEGAKEAVALAVSLCSTHKQPPPYSRPPPTC